MEGCVQQENGRANNDQLRVVEQEQPKRSLRKRKECSEGPEQPDEQKQKKQKSKKK